MGPKRGGAYGLAEKNLYTPVGKRSFQVLRVDGRVETAMPLGRERATGNGWDEAEVTGTL